MPTSCLPTIGALCTLKGRAGARGKGWSLYMVISNASLVMVTWDLLVNRMTD